MPYGAITCESRAPFHRWLVNRCIHSWSIKNLDLGTVDGLRENIANDWHGALIETLRG